MGENLPIKAWQITPSFPLSLTNIENRFNTKYCVQPHSKPHQLVVFACFSVIPRRF